MVFLRLFIFIIRTIKVDFFDMASIAVDEFEHTMFKIYGQEMSFPSWIKKTKYFTKGLAFMGLHVRKHVFLSIIIGQADLGPNLMCVSVNVWSFVTHHFIMKIKYHLSWVARNRDFMVP